MWKHVHECLKLEESFEFVSERRNQVQVLNLWKHASSFYFSQRGFVDIDVSLDELDEDTMAEERDSERRKVGLLDLWKRVDEFQ